MTGLVKADNFDLERCLREVEEASEQVHDRAIPESFLNSLPRQALEPLEVAEPYEKNCSKKHRAVHSSGTRPLSAIIWGIIHTEEAPTAESAARWFENSASGGSAPLCIDPFRCFRTLPDRAVAWAAPGANYHGLHFEQAGYARYTRQEWLKNHRGQIKRLAYKLAFHSNKYDFPLRFLTAAQLRAGYKGVSTHLRCTQAFGGTHVDPGSNYPMDILLADAKAFRRHMH